ncbi:MAG: Stp1/IreP family PP2C-type Ser/Thr phosphatase [Liquorilactobacillus nagelii]|uniref:protein-serine/threonine phosphatase n=1 Tax=Liquorilactobacillus nagelii TaxID=82688 RepID=A0A3S6QW26_9LACO|nr:Stp1/IreP family PP2C-type Ser/Thr phosphatase [Liquorilactobacillus nagelii]AUJ32376.1 protein phosphatase [Liquorilactobacillus nagelii]KRL40057.1 serine threonine specific protein phosphatase [Liquorilactobacillus nagelii DSM 13675]MCC7615560.1 serine/threonine-protein phosphatase [Liquorilactobacillus nagelii]MCI1634439.1 Stp1/IreP family PP2C-type Ser/Thr phosphatase [Liquorilactobacillus nagelii]MCI1699333.1 Stp1/IreP family PP2C-type Ser/Thr phosphatase [Liquorilactobacillus nagelii]
MEFSYKSDIGQVRERNEDYVGLFKNRAGIRFAVVADGLGGHRGGDVASEMAVSHLGYQFETTIFTDPHVGAKWLEEQVKQENQLILQRANQFSDLTGMGTTLVCALFFGKRAVLANIGDSRGYLLRDDKLFQLTEDHSLVNELVKRGQISSEEARHHPQKNIITRTLGVSDEAVLDQQLIELLPGDLLLLCTDGLTNMLEDQQLLETLLNSTTLSVKCENLIKQANEAGGKDNITVLAAAVQDEVEVAER